MAARISISQVEVKGEALQAIVQAMGLIQKRALKILTEHGLAPIEAEAWYPMSRLVDATRKIQTEIGPNTMRAVGRKLSENVLHYPSHVHTLDDALRFVNVSYQMFHRGAGLIGSYHYEPVGERKGRMVCDDPYPCDFDKGMLEALGERYRPKDSLWVRVEHLEQGCREKGAHACIYDIAW